MTARGPLQRDQWAVEMGIEHDLSPTQRFVLTRIAAASNSRTLESWRSVAHYQRETGYSDKAIRLAITALLELSVLVEQGTSARKRVLRLPIDAGWTPESKADEADFNEGTAVPGTGVGAEIEALPPAPEDDTQKVNAVPGTDFMRLTAVPRTGVEPTTAVPRTGEPRYVVPESEPDRGTSFHDRGTSYRGTAVRRTDNPGNNQGENQGGGVVVAPEKPTTPEPDRQPRPAPSSPTTNIPVDITACQTDRQAAAKILADVDQARRDRGEVIITRSPAERDRAIRTLAERLRDSRCDRDGWATVHRALTVFAPEHRRWWAGRTVRPERLSGEQFAALLADHAQSPAEVAKRVMAQPQTEEVF